MNYFINDFCDKELEFKTFKIYKEDNFRDYVIQPSSRRVDIIDVIDLILDFNETIQLDLI